MSLGCHGPESFTCIDCKKTLSIELAVKDRSRKAGHRNICRDCYSIRNKKFNEYRKEYYKERARTDPEFKESAKKRIKKYLATEKGRESRRRIREKYKENELKYNREYYWKHREDRIRNSNEWKRKNPEKVKQHAKVSMARRKKNPVTNLADRLRGSLKNVLKKKGFAKRGPTFSLLGIKPQDVYSHLVRYLDKPCVDCGITKITLESCHLDHISPISKAKTEAEVLLLSQLANLRLICGPCNLRKGDR